MSADSRTVQCRVPREAAGGRIDSWVHERLPELSRARVQALIRAGAVTVAGKPVKPAQRVREGQSVSVVLPIPAPPRVEGEPIPLDIVHEDDDVLVLHKPAGLVVHPAVGHRVGTLVNALLHHCPGIADVGPATRPGIVHRLDKDTSGLMVVAKSAVARESLTKQFRERRVRKEYLAVVCGVPAASRGHIETPYGRSRHDRKKMSARVTAGERVAVSDYEVIRTLTDASLVRVRIGTGRTHQIRVHMAYIGHPVLGDRQYGRRQSRLPEALRGVAPRQMLHAERLGFRHPTSGRPMDFSVPTPVDMQSVIERLEPS